MVPFSVIVFGVVVWTIAVSGRSKAPPFSLENRLVWTGPKSTSRSNLDVNPIHKHVENAKKRLSFC